MDRFKYYINKWVYDRVKYLDNTFYVQIHLTNKCQNMCKHCYYNEIPKQEDYDLKQLTKLLRLIMIRSTQLKLNPYVSFTGGDPFLYPNIYEAISECKKLNINYGVKCNPNIFLKNKNEWLDLVRDCKDISISLDGMKEKHDYWRGNGNFNKTLEAMSIIKDNNFALRVTTTISKQNMSDLLPLCSFLAQEKFIIDDYSWIRYWSEKNYHKVISADELPVLFDNFTNFIISCLSKNDFYYSNSNNQVLPRILFSFLEHQWIPYFIKNNYLDKTICDLIHNKNNSLNCTGNKNFYIADANGELYKCRKLTESKSSFHERTLINNIVLSTNLQCKNCYYYNECGGCAALSKALTGDKNSIEPNCNFFTPIDKF